MEVHWDLVLRGRSQTQKILNALKLGTGEKQKMKRRSKKSLAANLIKHLHGFFF